MTSSSRNNDNEDAITLCVRLYTLLLVAYPADFRRAYGPQMAQAFRVYCHEVYSGRGARGLVAVWITMLGDLVVSALGEWVAHVAARCTQERMSLMVIPTIPGSPVGPVRRLVTIALDIVLGAVALCVLYGVASLLYVFHPANRWTVGESDARDVLLSLLWLGVLVAFARRGQTPAHVLLRLRWIDHDGKRVAWRPIGDLSFWAAALPFLLIVAPGFEERVWSMLGVLLQFGLGWRIPLPIDMGGDALGPCYIVTAAVALGLTARARRYPAHVRSVPC